MAFGDVVQSNTGTGTTATTSPTLPSGVTAGNLVVLSFAADDYNGTPNAGWTQSTGMEQQTFHGGYTWWFIATSNGQAIPSYTVGSAVRSNWNLVEYAGPFDASPYDTSNGQKQEASTITYTTPAITPTAGDRLLIANVNFQQSGADIAAGGSWTNSFTQVTSTVYNGANPRLAVGQAKRVVTANGSTSYSTGATMATSQVAGSESGLIIAFKAGAAGGTNLTATPADNVAVADAATRTADRPRTITDPVSVSDQVTAQRTGSTDALLEDDVAISDTLITTWDRSATITDNVGVTDPGQSVESGANPSDAVGVADDPAAASDRPRTINDGAGVTDNLTVSSASILDANAEDDIDASDTVTELADRARNVEDPVGVTDQVNVERAGAGTADLADTLGVTDEITVAWSRVVTVDDFLNLTDAASASQTTEGGETLADPVGVTDSPGWSSTRARGPADQVGVSDAVVAVLDRTLEDQLADTVGVTDALSAVTTSPDDGRPVGNPTLTLTGDQPTLTLTGTNPTLTLTED